MVFEYLTKMLGFGRTVKPKSIEPEVTEKEYKSSLRILESVFGDSFFSQSDFNYANYLRGRIASNSII